jgi:diguanylate cyclase (GGDEF)-like protein
MFASSGVPSEPEWLVKHCSTRPSAICQSLWRALRAWSGRRHLQLARRGRMASRLIPPLAVLVTAGIILCTVLAYVLAQQADDHLEAEHRRALAAAVEALQAVSPDLARVEPKLIHVLERASGLKELRFEIEPGDARRRIQSMLDANGRIVGWFSWEAERPATAIMSRLVPLAGCIGLALVAFAALASWHLGRLGIQLARSERDRRKLEHQDVLTGLPNQTRFFELFDAVLASRQSADDLALAMLDLDGFDEVNDALGYAGGDQALAEIGRRLQRAVPKDAIIARLGSDEFALLMSGTNADAAMASARILRQALLRPFWMNQLIQVSVSIGLAVAPENGVMRDELMRRADLALRTAKRRGRGTAVAFEPEMEAEFQERRFLKREVARALAAHAFDVHYQPIVTAEGGTITGVEALLRWNHPARGLVPPSVFVPLAEEVGLMDRLGEFALRRAVSDAGRWPDLYVSVNLSPIQIRDRAFAELVLSVLQDAGLEPSRLVLEMTETVLVHDREHTAARLRELRALGVRLALDDFGSGYSSLSYLQGLPFDKLKIDRSFLAGLTQFANAGVIIQAIVRLGRALGMGVVIEGVETEEQRVLSRLAGCSELQGYLFGKPVPREGIDRLVTGTKAARTPVLLRAGARA